MTQSASMKPGATPVSLQTFGSFFVGGHKAETIDQTLEEYVLAPNGVPVAINPNGTTSVGQMYVQYLLGDTGMHQAPVVFCHGGSMTGTVWESTPDGRTGWLHDFFFSGWNVYNVDAVERGRAGWAPGHPAFSSKPILRTHQDTFTQFRIGSRVEDVSLTSLKAAAYPMSQFPLHAFGQFMKQVVPRWAGTDELISAAYIELLNQFEKPVILVAHSQGGSFVMRAAEQAPDKVAAIVLIEPAQAGTREGLETLALKDVPMLVVYGDHLDLDARWPSIRKRTDAYFKTLSADGGKVDFLDLPQNGVFGNSHLPMLELNNLEVSKLIKNWLIDNLS